MQVSVETTSGLERRLTVAVEEDRIADDLVDAAATLVRVRAGAAWSHLFPIGTKLPSPLSFRLVTS